MTPGGITAWFRDLVRRLSPNGTHGYSWTRADERRLRARIDRLVKQREKR